MGACQGTKGAAQVAPNPPGDGYVKQDEAYMKKSGGGGGGSAFQEGLAAMKDIKSFWTCEAADKLQESVDEIFKEEGEFLFGLDFSFSIADPFLEGCPLIGCSEGFAKLTGYGLKDIVGRNCRFLVDPVPKDQTDPEIRRHVKLFCEAVTLGEGYKIPPEDVEPWMPQGRPNDELVAFQRNAKKDGTLFWNLFYMKVFELSPEFGAERPFIVALQSDLPRGKEDLANLADGLEVLDARMEKLKAELSRRFFMRVELSRQDHFHTSSTVPQPLAYVSATGQQSNRTAPKELASAFPSEEVQSWDAGGFTMVRKIAEAFRNKGCVYLMDHKSSGMQCAVKRMPNSWMMKNQKEFVKTYPKETEMPWQDVGTMRFLNDSNFLYACNLVGVYRDREWTYVASEFAPEGDLFAFAENGEAPGPGRESKFALLTIKLFSAIRALHDMNIVHRDLSLENVLVTLSDDGWGIKLIDFGMASSERRFSNCKRGKPSYQAPEMTSAAEYDGFLSDSFAAGVIVFTMFTKEYPWQSTAPGACKCFEYVQKHGLQKCCEVRKVRGSTNRICDVITGSLLELLVNMLQMDPAKRLTMGAELCGNARSVFDEPWVKSQGITLYTGYRK